MPLVSSPIINKKYHSTWIVKCLKFWPKHKNIIYVMVEVWEIRFLIISIFCTKGIRKSYSQLKSRSAVLTKILRIYYLNLLISLMRIWENCDQGINSGLRIPSILFWCEFAHSIGKLHLEEDSPFFLRKLLNLYWKMLHILVWCSCHSTVVLAVL